MSLIAVTKTFLVAAFLALTATGTAFGQSGRVKPEPTPTPEETLKVETEEIRINVLAYDESGKFFDGVNAEDLVITENNILHQASSLRRIPASVLIVMDTGGQLRSVKSLDLTRKTAAALVTALNSADQIALIQYADKAEVISEWTTDRNMTMSAIGRTKFGSSSAFFDAIELASNMLVRDDIANRHLVLITDGTDGGSNSLERINSLRQLLTTDINVHVISYTGLEITDIEPRTKGISKSPPPQAMPDIVRDQLPNGPRQASQMPKIGPTINLDRKHIETMKRRRDDLQSAEEALSDLTRNTNGTMVIPKTREEMPTSTATVARIIDGSYVLTYIPKFSFAEMPDDRTITVTSRRPGLVVEARRKLIRKP